MPTMAEIPRSALIVDDERDIRELLVLTLGRMGLRTETAATVAAARAMLAKDRFDLCLTDMRLPDGSGMELVQELAARHPETPVAMITAHGNQEAAVEALKAGAFDFVSKPVDLNVLRGLVRQALDLNSSRQANPEGTLLLLGESPAMVGLRETIAKVARSQAPVHISGESGTGKELVARTIHAQGSRAAGPFIPVNCGAIPSELMESEFFGHKKGSFTGAHTDKPGLFQVADGGTLFLDEVGELPASMQAKLLRALQERSFFRLGSEKVTRSDFRIIAATNRDLHADMAAGTFREDLFYRLAVIRIGLPPLRERPEDILMLAQHFLKKYATSEGKPVVGIASPAAQKLIDYQWPGNVRELENCIERAVALTRMSEIGLDDLPDKIREHKNNQLVLGSDNLAELVTLQEIEQRYIQHVLGVVGGNKSQAARLLGLDRRSLYRRLAGAKNDVKTPGASN